MSMILGSMCHCGKIFSRCVFLGLVASSHCPPVTIAFSFSSFVMPLNLNHHVLNKLSILIFFCVSGFHDPYLGLQVILFIYSDCATANFLRISVFRRLTLTLMPSRRSPSCKRRFRRRARSKSVNGSALRRRCRRLLRNMEPRNRKLQTLSIHSRFPRGGSCSKMHLSRLSAGNMALLDGEINTDEWAWSEDFEKLGGSVNLLAWCSGVLFLYRFLRQYQCVLVVEVSVPSHLIPAFSNGIGKSTFIGALVRQELPGVSRSITIGCVEQGSSNDATILT
eukprot:284819545_6